MVKFTIEYKRTVRVREYETMTIGITQEDDTALITPKNMKDMIITEVNTWVDEELESLRKDT